MTIIMSLFSSDKFFKVKKKKKKKKKECLMIGMGLQCKKVYIKRVK